MLHLHHADHLDQLLDALAEVLTPAPADPFTPDLVVVPAAGMSDAAMVGLGRRLGASGPGAGDGVVANVEFVFPGRFMERALGDRHVDGHGGGRHGDVDGDPWRLPRLTWAVLDQLAAGAVPVPGPSGDVDRWVLARRIADLFDRYASQRARLLQAWAADIDSDGTFNPDGSPSLLDPAHVWQAQLWRAVRRGLQQPSGPERLPGLLAALRAGEVQPELPSRVSLFGLGTIAPTMLTVLRALGEVRDVHVFLRHPSMVAWQQSSHRLDGSLNVRAQLDVTTHTKHPLVGSWGRPSLETCALVGGVTELIELPCPAGEPQPASTTAPLTLLHALQQGIRLDLAPTLQPGLHPADGSLQVHACHGEVRQLEALRDALGHAFTADPALAPHDVLVLCPDLERFAPLAEAVFARGSLPVPVRIGDRSLTTDDPIVGALQTVLALVAGRVTLSEVLALVTFEPVRRRFGWTLDDVEHLAEWCSSLGTRWGLSPHDRTEWGLPADLATGTWQSMVDSLLAGAAMPAPSPRVVLGDVAPFDDIGADDLRLAGTVADLLARLGHLHEVVRQQRPVGQWVELLHDVVDGFCAVEPDEAWRRQAVHRDLDAILVSARTPPGGDHTCEVPLGLADVRAMLADSLHDRPGRLPLRSGSVTISSLLPQHGVPAKVICLLGLDEGSLRVGTFDGDDILGVHPCVGERHPRFEGRQLLLDIVLAARDRLIVTCNGADITTNKDTPFVVPLVELLDVVGHLTGIDPRVGAPVVVRHPRHGFNERALLPGALLEGSPSPFTFDRSMLAAAVARRGAQARQASAPVERSRWALPPQPLDIVDLADIIEVVGRPAKVYLRGRLDVRLPGEAETVDDGLTVAVDPLAASQLGSSLLRARRIGHSVDEWEAATRLDGNLPPRALAAPALAAAVQEVTVIEQLAERWSLPLAGGDERRVQHTLTVPVDGIHREITIDGVVRGITTGASGPVIGDVRYTKPRPSFRLALALQVAAAQLAEPDLDWSAVLISRGDKSMPVASGLRLRGSGLERAAHACTLLSLGVQLVAWARRDAVPLFDRTSYKLATESTASAFSVLDTDRFDQHLTMLWPDLSIERLLHLPILPGDPPQLAGYIGRGERDSRAMATARWVWRTYEETVEEFVAPEGYSFDDDSFDVASFGDASFGDGEGAA